MASKPSDREMWLIERYQSAGSMPAEDRAKAMALVEKHGLATVNTAHPTDPGRPYRNLRVADAVDRHRARQRGPGGVPIFGDPGSAWADYSASTGGGKQNAEAKKEPKKKQVINEAETYRDRRGADGSPIRVTRRPSRDTKEWSDGLVTYNHRGRYGRGFRVGKDPNAPGVKTTFFNKDGGISAEADPKRRQQLIDLGKAEGAVNSAIEGEKKGESAFQSALKGVDWDSSASRKSVLDAAKKWVGTVTSTTDALDGAIAAYRQAARDFPSYDSSAPSYQITKPVKGADGKVQQQVVASYGPSVKPGEGFNDKASALHESTEMKPRPADVARQAVDQIVDSMKADIDKKFSQGQGPRPNPNTKEFLDETKRKNQNTEAFIAKMRKQLGQGDVKGGRSVRADDGGGSTVDGRLWTRTKPAVDAQGSPYREPDDPLTRILQGLPEGQPEGMEPVVTRDAVHAAYKTVQEDTMKARGTRMDPQVAMIRALMNAHVIDTARAKDLAWSLRRHRDEALAMKLASEAKQTKGGPTMMGAKSTDWMDYYVPTTREDVLDRSRGKSVAHEATSLAKHGSKERALFLARRYDLEPGVEYVAVAAGRGAPSGTDSRVYYPGAEPSWAMPLGSVYSPYEDRYLDSGRNAHEISARRASYREADQALQSLRRFGESWPIRHLPVDWWKLPVVSKEVQRQLKKAESAYTRELPETGYLRYRTDQWLPKTRGKR